MDILELNILLYRDCERAWWYMCIHCALPYFSCRKTNMASCWLKTISCFRISRKLGGCLLIRYCFGTYHARTLGIVLFRLSFCYEWLDFLCRIVTSVKVRSDNCLDDLGIIGHFCHYSVLHILHPRWVHSSIDLGLLALRYSSEANGWNKNWSQKKSL